MIGIDIVEIKRIEKVIEKNEKFLERFFTKNEIEYFKSKNLKTQTIAGNFTAKEAISKALGTGIRNFKLSDIEVLRDELGCPYVNVYNNLENIIRDKNIKEIKVSISHSRDYAVSNAILIYY